MHTHKLVNRGTCKVDLLKPMNPSMFWCANIKMCTMSIRFRSMYMNTTNSVYCIDLCIKVYKMCVM